MIASPMSASPLTLSQCESVVVPMCYGLRQLSRGQRGKLSTGMAWTWSDGATKERKVQPAERDN